MNWLSNLFNKTKPETNNKANSSTDSDDEKDLKQVGRADSDALFHLGRMFYYGKDVDQDFEKAFNYFEKAAALGNARAQQPRHYVL